MSKINLNNFSQLLKEKDALEKKVKEINVLLINNITETISVDGVQYILKKPKEAFAIENQEVDHFFKEIVEIETQIKSESEKTKDLSKSLKSKKDSLNKFQEYIIAEGKYTNVDKGKFSVSISIKEQLTDAKFIDFKKINEITEL